MSVLCCEGVPNPLLGVEISQDVDDMDFSAPQKSQLSRLTDRPRLRRLKDTLLSKGDWQQVTRIEDLCHAQVPHKWLLPPGRVRGKSLDTARLHCQRSETTR